MQSRLIINADDFGLTEGINHAVGELHRAGVLSSATLMANGGAFQHAVSLAKTLPGLGVGCHVVLTDGQPISPPSAIASLLGPDGQMLRSSLGAFARAALFGRLREDDIETEASAQISRLKEAGIHPTHLDTHKHTHMFPHVLRPLLRVAERFSIPAIRNPFEQRWSIGVGRGRTMRRMQVRLLRTMEPGFHAALAKLHGRIKTTAGAIGVSATGDLEDATLGALLDRLPHGTWELVCHPGHNDGALAVVRTRLRAQREIEREALTRVVPHYVGEDHAVGLISFAAL